MRLLALRVIAFLLLAQVAAAEVVRVEVRRRDDFGTHERLIGRVFFEIDPTLPANAGIADVALAPRNARGRVEFSGDLLFFVPKSSSDARGTVFLEVVNRGRDQALGLLSDARQPTLAPEAWNLGDRFLLEQGFTVAFLGWQFDVRPSDGLTFEAPVVPVEGTVRVSYVDEAPQPRFIGLRLPYCVTAKDIDSTQVTFRTRIEAPAQALPRSGWQFDADRCVIRFAGTSGPGLYDIVYRASGSPIAGLGLAAIRDFASYLKHAPDGSTLRENPAAARRVVGFGYSQSGRFLREFVRDGFNADERGRAAFDGIMIASAGAGGCSCNHRFAMPGQAGNSVLSILRPVDIPPFRDEGLLAKAQAARTVPKIFYTFTASEYWARAGSLTHTTDDGMGDAPFAPTSRLYFMSSTPHASGILPLTRVGGQYKYNLNFAEQRWTMRALLMALDDWVRSDTAPPPSVYPTIAKGDLVPLDAVRFPSVPSFPFPGYMPKVWRMDYGPEFASARVITREPPALGEQLRVLVPQVDADGHDLGGIRIPEVAVPLGTFTAWNITNPQFRDLGYLAGLVGSFEPFAATAEERKQAGDARLSIAERYRNRQEYLDRVAAVAKTLVGQRFMLAADVDAVMDQAERIWDALAR